MLNISEKEFNTKILFYKNLGKWKKIYFLCDSLFQNDSLRLFWRGYSLLKMKSEESKDTIFLFLTSYASKSPKIWVFFIKEFILLNEKESFRDALWIIDKGRKFFKSDTLFLRYRIICLKNLGNYRESFEELVYYLKKTSPKKNIWAETNLLSLSFNFDYKYVENKLKDLPYLLACYYILQKKHIQFKTIYNTLPDYLKEYVYSVYLIYQHNFKKIKINKDTVGFSLYSEIKKDFYNGEFERGLKKIEDFFLRYASSFYIYSVVYIYTILKTIEDSTKLNKIAYFEKLKDEKKYKKIEKEGKKIILKHPWVRYYIGYSLEKQGFYPDALNYYWECRNEFFFGFLSLMRMWKITFKSKYFEFYRKKIKRFLEEKGYPVEIY